MKGVSDEEIAIIPTVAKDSILNPTPKAATASEPWEETNLLIYPSTIGLSIIANAAGNPMINIGKQVLINEFRFLSGNDNSPTLLIEVIMRFIPIMYEIVVAIAAPFIPIGSIGPKPKIKIGSKMALIPEVAIIIKLGVVLSPFALKIELPITRQAKKGAPIYQVDI